MKRAHRIGLMQRAFQGKAAKKARRTAVAVQTRETQAQRERVAAIERINRLRSQSHRAAALVALSSRTTWRTASGFVAYSQGGVSLPYVLMMDNGEQA